MFQRIKKWCEQNLELYQLRWEGFRRYRRCKNCGEVIEMIGNDGAGHDIWLHWNQSPEIIDRCEQIAMEG